MNVPPFDVEETLAALTLEEKASLLSGADDWFTQTIDRPGLPAAVPAIEVGDGPHGLRKETGVDMVWVPATAFPTASAMGASWDRDLMRRVATAIGEEAQAEGVQVVLGPGVNMKRSPLCGRNFEYFSEDPLHSGELGAAYVDGVQSVGVGTSLKHFAANNQEIERTRISVVADERTLREIYLPAFERVVRLADPWTVMCSYNRLLGVHASQNRWLLTEVLREDWGLRGAVVSDWNAVHDRVAALRARARPRDARDRRRDRCRDRRRRSRRNRSTNPSSTPPPDGCWASSPAPTQEPTGSTDRSWTLGHAAGDRLTDRAAAAAPR